MILPDCPISVKKNPSDSLNPARITSSRIAHFGLAIKHQAGWIAAIQWAMISLYLFLLFAPWLLSMTTAHPALAEELRLFALFVFWGFGWPLILLSTMVFGRLWCGIFCPDGALTEMLSRYGRKQSIPRWIRWRGWIFLTLLLYTTAFSLLNATSSHWATLVLLGSLTLTALLTGFFYGNAKRVWCMYLCPSNGLFIFLAKVAPFYFHVSPEKWDTYDGPHERLNCAPLINIKRMESTSACHACGRCSGYRDAVELAMRAPDSEILSGTSRQTGSLQALTLFTGLTGVCITALFWAKNPFLPNVPFISLPAAFIFISGGGMLLGALFYALIRLSAKMAWHPKTPLPWQQLALGLIPLAGTGLFSALTSLFLSFMLPAEWLRQGTWILQMVLLLTAFLFSLWLGWRLIMLENNRRNTVAFIIYTFTCGLLCGIWMLFLHA